ncbi:PAS domain-containing sensor histidine kinase [Georgenia sp. 311]|uniref:sensor histidine kinase n=1 Tax=Georgenia sp. 311 TaxID=2585134 RepID=UPI0011123EA4|nr:PAS domain-containing sensor histidine kinase [Georgenia sp. 311]TNC18539.1 PAS domain-containing sensor histidine kinase [Georgenia sp. 311]
MSGHHVPAPADGGHHRFVVLGRQLPFTGVFGVLVVAVILWREHAELLPGAVLVAIGISAVATVLAAAAPWPRLPRWTEATVPLLDMAAVVALLSNGTRASVLIVLPVLWLARMGRTGTVVAVLTGVAASTSVDVVTALERGALVIGPDNASRFFIVPAVVIAVACYLGFAEDRATSRSALLARQNALVARLLEETSQDRARLEGVLDTIDAGVAVVGPDGRIVVANRSLETVTGGRAVPGAPITVIAEHLYLADGLTPVGEERLRSVATGEAVDRRVVWWAPAADERTAFRVSAGPLPGPDGRSDGAVLALHDVTGELQALSEREDFVSSVSHELRTPLTSVTGYLDLALDDPDLPPHLRTYLDVADRNAGRLRILIDNLLTAARTGADVASREPVDLRSVVADVVESQTPRADDRDITVEVAAEGDAVVAGDVGRLTQVVDNVVSNAVKYTRPGGHVRIELVGAPRRRVRLTVTDDGPGIAADAQQRLFSRFYRAPEVRNGPVQGTGLGLHISRQIVEALGGTIALRSGPGSGTNVDVLLPAWNDDGQAAGPRPPRPERTHEEDVAPAPAGPERS